MRKLSAAKRMLAIIALILAAMILCFLFGFVVSDKRNLSEIEELLQDNLRLRVTVNVYQFNYGELTEQDLSAYLEKDGKPAIKKTEGVIGPI
jgi:hypothetical protein